LLGSNSFSFSSSEADERASRLWGRSLRRRKSEADRSLENVGGSLANFWRWVRLEVAEVRWEGRSHFVSKVSFGG